MAIGAILSQDERPIAYFSENLNDAKQKYSSYDKGLCCHIGIEEMEALFDANIICFIN